MKPERRLQLQVCEYLKTQYPKVIFWANDSGERKPMGLAVLGKRMRSVSKLPDMWISEARGGYHGLYIELKADSPYKKGSVELRKNEHNEAQSEMLEKLEAKGYRACFAWSLEMAIEIIKIYMNQTP